MNHEPKMEIIVVLQKNTSLDILLLTVESDSVASV